MIALARGPFVSGGMLLLIIVAIIAPLRRAIVTVIRTLPGVWSLTALEEQVAAVSALASATALALPAPDALRLAAECVQPSVL